MLDFEQSLKDERIFVTGHTGFTGSWVCHWLDAIHVDYYGYSLRPNTTPNLFTESGLDKTAPGEFGDIMNVDALRASIDAYKPTMILHLAAQPLVRQSYKDPVYTFAVNTLGTAHLLDAAKGCDSVKGVVCITTDKVYQNKEWVWSYRENDRLGGKDPYSASKSAAEIVIASYQASFPEGPKIAVARGGNIIGGGDWADDRLVPDYVRSVKDGTSITLRYPEATRPWQHVLALIEGYFMLLSGLKNDPAKTAQAWNLGPTDPKEYSVRDVFEILGRAWSLPDVEYMDNPAPESLALGLDSSLANHVLKWNPKWTTEKAIKETAAWYKDYYEAPDQCKKITCDQIATWRAR